MTGYYANATNEKKYNTHIHTKTANNTTYLSQCFLSFLFIFTYYFLWPCKSECNLRKMKENSLSFNEGKRDIQYNNPVTCQYRPK